MLAAATEAAARQGRFWELHDAIFADPGRTDDPHLWAHARRLGLDLERFERDRRSAAVAARVREQTRAGMRAGVALTPTLIAGGTVFPRRARRRADRAPDRVGSMDPQIGKEPASSAVDGGQEGKLHEQ